MGAALPSLPHAEPLVWTRIICMVKCDTFVMDGMNQCAKTTCTMKPLGLAAALGGDLASRTPRSCQGTRFGGFPGSQSRN